MSEAVLARFVGTLKMKTLEMIQNTKCSIGS